MGISTLTSYRRRGPSRQLARLSGCSGWWDASDRRTFSLSGSTINQWRDKSGNNRHFGTPSVGSKPTLLAGAIKGRSVVRCAAGSQSLQGENWFLNNIFTAGAHTAFIVAKSTIMGGAQATARTNPCIMAAGVSAGACYWGIATRTNYTFTSQANVTGSTYVEASITADTADFNIFVDQHDGTNLTLGRAGATVASVAIASISAIGTNRVVAIGRNPSNNAYAPCDIAEIIVYNRSLSPSEKAQVISYLTTKYGLYSGNRLDDIPNMQLWLDARTSASITQSGSLVSAWATRTGSGYSFANSTDATKPTYSATSYKGGPGIDFGTGDWLRLTNAAFKDDTACTLLVALKPNAATYGSGNYTPYGALLGIGRNTGNYVQYGGQFAALTNEVFSFRKNASATLGAGYRYLGHMAGDAFIQGLTTGSSGTKLYRESQEISLTLESSATAATDFSPAAAVPADNEVVLGGVATGAATVSATLNAIVAGVAYWDRVLTSDERASALAYMQWLYGTDERTADVFVFAGQSNMDQQGMQAEAPAAYQADTAGIFTYNQGVTTGGLYYLTVANSGSSEVTQFGPDVPFGHAYRQATGRNFVAVKLAVGGSSLAVEWKATVPVGASTQSLNDELTLALAALRGHGFVPTLKAFVWCQGESDVVSSGAASAYSGRFQSFVDYWQAGFSLPRFITVLTSPGIDDGALADIVTVRSAQTTITKAEGGLIVETYALPLKVDQTHFTTASIIAIGKAASAAAVAGQDTIAAQYLT